MGRAPFFASVAGTQIHISRIFVRLLNADQIVGLLEHFNENDQFWRSKKRHKHTTHTHKHTHTHTHSTRNQGNGAHGEKYILT